MVSNEQLNELSDHFSDPHVYWKKVMLSLYQEPCELVFPARNSDGTKKENMDFSHIKELAKFSESIGLSDEISQSVNDINKVVLASNGNVKGLITAFIVFYLESIFEKLEQWGYVEFKLNISAKDESFEYCTWNITAKGIEIALKLQDREDDEDRQELKQLFNKQILFIAIFVLIMLAISIGLDYKTLV